MNVSCGNIESSLWLDISDSITSCSTPDRVSSSETGTQYSCRNACRFDLFCSNIPESSVSLLYCVDNAYNGMWPYVVYKARVYVDETSSYFVYLVVQTCIILCVFKCSVCTCWRLCAWLNVWVWFEVLESSILQLVQEEVCMVQWLSACQSKEDVCSWNKCI